MKSLAALGLLLLFAGTVRAEDPRPAGPGPNAPRVNHLAGARSPYLRQHATNPVDWYPWGAQAFAEARRQGKPIFLSIGYAACHWCHVMAHESFENKAIARQLNEAFVCIKVDREERPDLDRIYMNAVYALGKRGGWPMTVILTPERLPFWAGTYLSPARLRSTIQSVRGSWQRDPAGIRRRAARIAKDVARLSAAPRLRATGLADSDILARAASYRASRFDARNGGYAASKKFPPHGALRFLLEAGGRYANATERSQAAATLRAMALGGIHDQVGGGFHRYTVDRVWLVPHFEKMLYDNAMLAGAYAALAARQGPSGRGDDWAGVARDTLAWIERDLKRASGGYASSLDADTRGEEGATYTWSLAQLQRTLGAEEGRFAAAWGHATRRGTLPSPGLFGSTGRNVLYRHLGPAPLVRQGPRVQRIRRALLAARNRRHQPALDEKVIAAWNGLLLSAFAKAGVNLKDARYLERGRALAGFLLTQCRTPDGALLRFPKGHGQPLPGFLEDYAYVTDGLLDLADATKDATYAEAAHDLGRRMRTAFEDTRSGGFWSVSETMHEPLIARAKGYRDVPLPADNGVATVVCLRLFARFGEPTFRDAADRSLALYRPLLAAPSNAFQMSTLLQALRLRARIEAGPRTASGRLVRRQGVVRVELTREPTPARAPPVSGSTAERRLRLQVTLDTGWHVNAHEPSEARLIPTAVRLEDAAGQAHPAQVQYPEPVRRRLGSAERPSALYAGRFQIGVRFAREPAAKAAGPWYLILTLQPCSDDRCEEPLTFRLPLAR